MALIYIVEDDKNIQEIEEYALKSNGYEVQCFDEAGSFERALDEKLPDLIMLDIMLPGDDGLTVLRRLRNHPVRKEIPVIMVTAKVSEIDTVKGLDMGADDYITKPFGIMELISRVKAILRRIKPVMKESVLELDQISLDLERHICTVDGTIIELTYKEYELLKLFLLNLGIVMSRDAIMSAVWDADFAGETRTIDIHINTLRKKLGEAGNHIVTIRNVGYTCR